MTTTDRNPAARHAGARVRLSRGQAHLVPAAPTPVGMLAGRVSVLSPGTEHRHLAATLRGPARDAGYMSLGETYSGWVLSPSPHGAAFSAGLGGSLSVPRGVDQRVAALARFQLMSMAGLDRVAALTSLQDTVVVGSGPVALGCVLELRRRGAERVRVLTSRPLALIGRAPGAVRVAEVAASSAPLVIDAIGVPRLAATLVVPAGVLGLLGTPDESSVLSGLAVHRGGWAVVGMHELVASADVGYQRAYNQAVAWLTHHLDPGLAASWCLRLPGHCAPRILNSLGRPDRPAQPIILFEWAP